MSLTAKESDWKRGKVFYPLMFMAYEKKFSFIGIVFEFVGSHPVLNRDKALLYVGSSKRILSYHLRRKYTPEYHQRRGGEVLTNYRNDTIDSMAGVESEKKRSTTLLFWWPV